MWVVHIKFLVQCLTQTVIAWVHVLRFRRPHFVSYVFFFKKHEPFDFVGTRCTPETDVKVMLKNL
jgi:hypothetical protein